MARVDFGEAPRRRPSPPRGSGVATRGRGGGALGVPVARGQLCILLFALLKSLLVSLSGSELACDHVTSFVKSFRSPMTSQILLNYMDILPSLLE